MDGGVSMSEVGFADVVRAEGVRLDGVCSWAKTEEGEVQVDWGPEGEAKLERKEYVVLPAVCMWYGYGRPCTLGGCPALRGREASIKTG